LLEFPSHVEPQLPRRGDEDLGAEHLALTETLADLGAEDLLLRLVDHDSEPSLGTDHEAVAGKITEPNGRRDEVRKILVQEGDAVADATAETEATGHLVLRTHVLRRDEGTITVHKADVGIAEKIPAIAHVQGHEHADFSCVDDGSTRLDPIGNRERVHVEPPAPRDRVAGVVVVVVVLVAAAAVILDDGRRLKPHVKDIRTVALGAVERLGSRTVDVGLQEVALLVVELLVKRSLPVRTLLRESDDAEEVDEHEHERNQKSDGLHDFSP